MDIRTLADAVNSQAGAYAIGELQQLRTTLKNFKRVPGSAIFSTQTTFEDWAFHHGGRSELQFNIGAEQFDNAPVVRYGVAFSFETSRTLPAIDVLVPKVQLFNEYVRTNSDLLSGFEMWHFQDGVRSIKHAPTPIPADLVRSGTFVFLGGYSLSGSVEASDVLSAFDRLLTLYSFVEGGGVVADNAMPFMFRSGNAAKKSHTLSNATERALSIDLRHNEIQEALYRELCQIYGEENVGTENPSGTGGRIDVVLRCGDTCTYFEIKVGRSVKNLIREALGQLLEYSLWPGSTLPERLVIVGEPEIGEAGRSYLSRISKGLPIPVSYKQMSLS